MTRLPLVAIALLLTLAPAAHGEAVGLRDDLHAEQVALAGPGGRGSSELTVKAR